MGPRGNRKKSRKRDREGSSGTQTATSNWKTSLKTALDSYIGNWSGAIPMTKEDLCIFINTLEGIPPAPVNVISENELIAPN